MKSLSSASSNIRYWFTTGCPPLDVILTGKVGTGLPAGRVCELFGKENVGKTTLGVEIIRHVQQAGGLGCIIDTEATFTAVRGLGLGLNEDALVYIEEQYVEPIIDAISETIDAVGMVPTVIFWDTIAGTPSVQEIGHKIGEGPLGIHARALSQGFRRIARPLANSNVLLLACNQLKVGAMAKPFATERETDATLGGSAIKFHAEIRLKLDYGRKVFKEIGKRKQEVGFEGRATAVKNKGFVQGGKARLIFLYSDGGRFNSALSCLRTLQDWNVVGKGKSIQFNGEKLSEDKWSTNYIVNRGGMRTVVHKLLEDTFVERFGIAKQNEEDEEEE